MKKLVAIPQGRQTPQNRTYKPFIQRDKRYHHRNFPSYDRCQGSSGKCFVIQTEECNQPFQETPLIPKIINQGATVTQEIFTDDMKFIGTDVKAENKGLDISSDPW